MSVNSIVPLRTRLELVPCFLAAHGLHKIGDDLLRGWQLFGLLRWRGKSGDQEQKRQKGQRTFHGLDFSLGRRRYFVRCNL